MWIKPNWRWIKPKSSRTRAGRESGTSEAQAGHNGSRNPNRDGAGITPARRPLRDRPPLYAKRAPPSDFRHSEEARSDWCARGELNPHALSGTGT